MRYLLLIALLGAAACQAQDLPIGTRDTTFYDPVRDRNIGTVVHYPAMVAGVGAEPAAGAFPVLVFGHGFLMGVEAYGNIRDHFVPRGYILVLPTTEGGFPDHEAFGEDLAFLAGAFQAAGADPVSPFFGHVAPRTALMGHSMGGGASVLGASGNTSIQALVNLAAAETDPSAIAAAAGVTVPALIIAGAEDCVTPPDQHQIPIHSAIASACKSLMIINGGGHCAFAESNLICSIGESTCGGASITREEQHDVVNDIAGLWLDAFLKDDPIAYGGFLDSLTTSTRLAGTTTCLSTGITKKPADPITLHPVPAADLLFVTGLSEARSVSITDATGRLVMRGRIGGDIGPLDISCLRSGMYRMAIEDPGGIEHRSFVVQQ